MNQIVGSPFKGKRKLFRAAEDAQREIDRLTVLVDTLIDSWKTHGASSGISLHMEPRSKRLRWRATIRQFNHQRHIEYDGEDMLEVRNGLTDQALTLLIGYEHRRLVLNLKLAIARVNLSEHQRYVAFARELEKSAPDGLKSPYA